MTTIRPSLLFKANNFYAKTGAKSAIRNRKSEIHR